MSWTHWLRNLKFPGHRTGTVANGRRAERCRPHLEALEDRCLLSAGQLDPTFGSGGAVLTGVRVPTHNYATVVTTQTDGKVVAAGTTYFGPDEFSVVRYNADGSLDTGFNGGGRISFNFAGSGYGTPTSVTIDSAGRIIVAGYVYFYNGTGYDFAVARLNANGTLDTSFNGTGLVTIDFGADDVATGAAIDAAGRIVLSGTTETLYTGSDEVAVARLNSDGSLDTRFGTGGKATVSIGPGGTTTYSGPQPLSINTAGMALDASGRIVIAGDTYRAATGNDFAVTRLNSDGSLDTSFGAAGVASVSCGTGNTNDVPCGMALDATGRIVVAGTSAAATNLSSSYDFAVARFNADGSLDGSFGSGGTATVNIGPGLTYDDATGMALDAAGRVVVAGFTYLSPNYDFAVARLNTDGSLDGGFGAGGKETLSFGTGSNLDDRAAGVTVDAAGRIVVAGSTRDTSSAAGLHYDFAVARLDSGGNLDSTWGGSGKVTTDLLVPINAFATNLTVSQPDGKIIVVGDTYNNTIDDVLVVARYNSDGSPDTSFAGNGTATLRTSGILGLNPTAAAVDASGRIVIAGYIYGPGGFHPAVVRVNADGSLDSSFGTAGTAAIPVGPYDGQFGGHEAEAVALDALGRIVVAGTSDNSLGSTSDFAVTRLNANGSLDTGFATAGRAIVSFGPNTYDSVSSVAIDAAGHIVVAGSSSAGAGAAVIRLNADGSPDAGFGTGGTAFAMAGPGSASSMVLDAAGRIVIAGIASNPYGPAEFALTRLNTDGSPDTNFGTGGTAALSFGIGYTNVNRMAIDPNTGRIAVVGATAGNNTTIYPGSFAVALFQANGCPDLDFGVGGEVTTSPAGPIYPASVANGVAFDAAGRLIVAGYTESSSGYEFALVRYITHDPVVQAGSATFAADLQAAITTAVTPGYVGIPGVVVHVQDPARMPAVVDALAKLKVKHNMPLVDVFLDVDPGTYSLGKVAVPAGLRLIINGASNGQLFTGSAAPALTVISGDVLIYSGVQFTSTGNAAAIAVQGGNLVFDCGGQVIAGSSGPALLLQGGTVDIHTGAVFGATGNTSTIVVKGGQLTMRGSTVTESASSNLAALAISGGLVDLGTGYPDLGQNTIAGHAQGLLIDNTGPNDVPAAGDTFMHNGVPSANNFRVEDAIDDALATGHGGLVFLVPGTVFVSATTGNLQRGVNVVPAGDTVSVEAGVSGSFKAGPKLLTVAFADGSYMTQEADSLDPKRRTLVVDGTVGNDTIAFAKDGGGVRVNMNQVPSGTFQPTGRLTAYGLDGSDTISVSADIRLSAWLFGGYSGTNRLQGGGGDDVLVGGQGDDTLIAGTGRDMLVGDGGTNHLVGGSNDDILIGGYCGYAGAGSVYEPAEAAIMAEWTSGHNYATRVSNLINGTGLTNGYSLSPDGSVFDNGNANVLHGGSGQDLFFVGALDQANGVRANETVLTL